MQYGTPCSIHRAGTTRHELFKRGQYDNYEQAAFLTYGKPTASTENCDTDMSYRNSSLVRRGVSIHQNAANVRWHSLRVEMG